MGTTGGEEGGQLGIKTAANWKIQMATDDKEAKRSSSLVWGDAGLRHRNSCYTSYGCRESAWERGGLSGEAMDKPVS